MGLVHAYVTKAPDSVLLADVVTGDTGRPGLEPGSFILPDLEFFQRRRRRRTASTKILLPGQTCLTKSLLDYG